MNEATLRPATTADRAFLHAMLTEAFNWRADPHFDPTILASPAVAHYLDGWRRPTDFGIIAERQGQPAGAAWARFLTAADPGYGYVADSIPELTLAVAPGHRGHRIGPALLGALTAQAQRLALPAVSLSVEDGNHARSLYERHGFVVVGREGNSDTMVLTFA